MDLRTLAVAFLVVLVVGTAPAAATTPGAASVPGDDCTVDTADLGVAIGQWVTGDLSTDRLREVIRHWATQRPLPDCGTAGVTVTVTDVVDGDTLDVRYENGSTDTVRLVGVDTPEVHVENDPAEFEGIPDSGAGHDWLRQWGYDASRYVQGLIGGETVRLTFDGEAGRRGGFGRLLAYVHVNDSVELNAALVEGGYARVYSEGEFREEAALLEAETRARSAEVGLWGYGNDTGDPSTGTLAVVEIHADAAGNDHENLDDEYVVFENTGTHTLELGGWSVADEAGHGFTVPAGFSLAPGERVTLYTGSGTDTDSELYWGSGSAVWNNGGDTVVVTTDGGEVVLEREYQ